MIVQAANPQSYAEMVQAHKARQSRKAEAARRNANRPKLPPPVNLAKKLFVTQRMPMWMIRDIQFDAHAWSYVTWKLARTANIRNYIRQRCTELCAPYAEITCGGQSRSLVPVRDKIVYEIKSKLDPEISWGSLGKHFNRDHSSMISSYRRGAADAGDPIAMAALERQRDRHRKAHRAVKARAE